MYKTTQVKTQFRPEQWEKLISDCQNSGLPVLTWCVQNRLKERKTKHLESERPVLDSFGCWIEKLIENLPKILIFLF